MIESSRDDMSRLREAVYKYNAERYGASNILVNSKLISGYDRLFVFAGIFTRKPFEEERNHTRWFGFEMEPYYD